MTAESTPIETEPRRTKVIHHNRGASEAVYGLGLIGAWVYYFTHAGSFMLGVLGFFKGIFWPAFLVYELLKFLNI